MQRSAAGKCSILLIFQHISQAAVLDWMWQQFLPILSKSEHLDNYVSGKFQKGVAPS
jgi:CRP/FNR family transcriptional regulator, cyclic AMP receptor protein